MLNTLDDQFSIDISVIFINSYEYLSSWKYIWSILIYSLHYSSIKGISHISISNGVSIRHDVLKPSIEGTKLLFISSCKGVIISKLKTSDESVCVSESFLFCNRWFEDLFLDEPFLVVTLGLEGPFDICWNTL